MKEELKGTLPRDFRLNVFFLDSVFPGLLEYSIRDVSKIRGDIRSSSPTTPVANGKYLQEEKFKYFFGHLWVVQCQQHQRYRWQFKFGAGHRDTGDTFTCEYLCKFEMTLMLFLGAWGKVIHEKKMKQKSL